MFFKNTPLLPEDPIFGLPIAFKADERLNKINLGVGAYQTAEGHPYVLSSVRRAENQVLHKNLDKEYLPIEGDQEFLKVGLALLLGNDHPFLQSGCFFSAQSVGGASALRIGAEFLKLMCKTIFISQPTWSNHKQIFEKAGLTVESYPYLDSKTLLFDAEGMFEAVRNMPTRSVILLHGCCHNPTGIDPSFENWKELSELIKARHLIPFFDIAYQGFGQGLDEDAQAMRYFINQRHEMLIAYSFSKNFGLYGERVGFLTVTSNESEYVNKIGSQIKTIIRANYSNPPIHGARLVSSILKSRELTKEWEGELENMRERIREMRKALVSALEVQKQGYDFSFMHKQNGLFSFTGLNPAQVLELRKEKAIYMPPNGRINVAGLNPKNISYVAASLLSVL